MASVDEFDEIEFQAARTGNHARAASRMDELASQAGASYRAEAYLRAGDQWMMAGEAQLAVDDFRTAIEDGGPTSADPRVYLTRALLDLGQAAEAGALLAAVRAERDTVTPRTCDLLAEILTEQGDLRGALEWATAGVEHCIEHEDDAELQLLLRLRYRIRVDLGMDEDDYDKMLDGAGPSSRLESASPAGSRETAGIPRKLELTARGCAHGLASPRENRGSQPARPGSPGSRRSTS